MRTHLFSLLLAACSSVPPPPPLPTPAAPPAPASGAGRLELSARIPWIDRGVSFAGGGQPLALTAMLSGGALALSPPLDVTVTALSPAGGALATVAMTPTLLGFRAKLQTASLPDGPLRLVATARDRAGDSWTSAAIEVTIDNTPPRVTLQIPDLEAGVLPRDFTAQATVVADDGRGAGVVSFELTGSGVPRSSVAVWPLIAQATYGGPGALGKARVNGRDLRLDGGPGSGLAGTFEITALATDGVGNVGVACLPVPVTRLRWKLDGAGFSTAPVLSRHGRLLVGDVTGRLWAVQPDGNIAWSTVLSGLPLAATPAVWAGPAGEDVFVPTAEGRFQALDVADGSLRKRFAVPEAQPFESAPAIDPTGGTVVLASSDGALWGFDARTGSRRGRLAPPPRNASAPTAVSLAGTLGLVGRADGALMLFDAAGPTLLATPEAPTGLAAGDADAPAFSGRTAWLAGTVYSLGDPSGSLAAADPRASAAGPIDVGAVVDGAGNVFLAGQRALVQLPPSGVAGWAVPLAAPPSSSPTLGADGLLYLPTEDGQLSAVSPGGALLWSARLGSGRGTAPMLDPCRRTLYLATQDGPTGALWAIAVDSPGLDVRAAVWPHARHDYQGTGNAAAAGLVECGPRLGSD